MFMAEVPPFLPFSFGFTLTHPSYDARVNDKGMGHAYSLILWLKFCSLILVFTWVFSVSWNPNVWDIACRFPYCVDVALFKFWPHFLHCCSNVHLCNGYLGVVIFIEWNFCRCGKMALLECLTQLLKMTSDTTGLSSLGTACNTLPRDSFLLYTHRQGKLDDAL